MSTASVARALLIGLLALLPALAVQAAGEDLFRIEVPVADRGPSSRDAALTEALDGVLVRLTGVAAPRTLPGADVLLGQPARVVRAFQYREGPEDGLLLEVTFEPAALEQAVRAAVSAVAEPLDLSPEVVLEPRDQRFLAWAPLDPSTPTDPAVADRLAESQARPWQVALVRAAVTEALSA